MAIPGVTARGMPMQRMACEKEQRVACITTWELTEKGAD